MQPETGPREPLYRRFSLELLGAREDASLAEGGARGIVLETSQGDIRSLLHEPASQTGRAVLWLPGARGGFAGPAGGVYAELASALADGGVASLRLDYRHAADLDHSTLDALAGVWHLAESGYPRVAVVGHSFGGGVAIATSRYSTHIRAVAALSSQTMGAEDVVLLGGRPLLVAHGEADGVLPLEVSGQQIYSWAFEPKRLVTFPGAGHGLRECRDELAALLRGWLEEVLPPEASSGE